MSEPRPFPSGGLIGAGALLVAPSPHDLGVLRRIREEWLARAGREIDAARVIAQAPGCPDPEIVIKHLQQTLNAAAEADCVAAEDRLALALEARSVARIACQRVLEDLLERGHALVRRPSPAQLGPLLAKAAELIGTLVQLQLDRETYDRLKTKLDILQQTNARGDSAKAKLEEPVDTKPFVRDQRLFMRYVEPALLVRLADQRYRVRNWSLGGLVLVGVSRLPVALGTLVDLQFSLEKGLSYADRATVLRFDASRCELALQLRRFGSRMVTLRQWCDARGLLRS